MGTQIQADLSRFDRWSPKLLVSLRNYNLQDFGADLLAGVTVGLVALPLAMAFGIASGVTPQAGLYTAVVAGFLISALGGSRVQIGGPTGAFVVIVGGIVAKFGVSGLLIVTLLAGAILILMGATGLGTAVKFIPRPVTIGFTNGIAVLIASTQIKDFLGLKTGATPSDFAGRMRVIFEHLQTAHWPTIVLSSASLAIIVLWPRLTRRVPGSIVALLAGTLAVIVLALPVETIGTKFGGIPGGLPPFSVPKFRPDLILPLLPSALTVALLAAVESLLSAMVADSMSGDRHNSNVELIAGRRQSRLAAVWRHTRYGRHCADGDQHSLGGKDTCGRHRACAHLASDPACGRALGSFRAARYALGSSFRGGLQHG
jgi:sulfate permease, SulP family